MVLDKLSQMLVANTNWLLLVHPFYCWSKLTGGGKFTVQDTFVILLTGVMLTSMPQICLSVPIKPTRSWENLAWSFGLLPVTAGMLWQNQDN
jgi:hypothetical protein